MTDHHRASNERRDTDFLECIPIVNIPACDISMVFDCEYVAEVRRGVGVSVATLSALLLSECRYTRCFTAE